MKTWRGQGFLAWVTEVEPDVWEWRVKIHVGGETELWFPIKFSSQEEAESSLKEHILIMHESISELRKALIF